MPSQVSGVYGFFSYIEPKSEHRFFVLWFVLVWFFFDKTQATFSAAPTNTVIKTPAVAHAALPFQSSAVKNGHLFSS